MRMRAWLLVVAVGLSASAQAGPPKGSPKKGERLDLGIPTFGTLPTSTELAKPKEQTLEHKSTGGDSTEHCYTVVSITHGRSFKRGPGGTQPDKPYPAVLITGNPPYSDRFSSIVKVKCPARRGGSIEVEIEDAQGNMVMNGSGQIAFKNQDETEWQIDWSDTPMRNEGEFKFVLRIAGNLIGSFPILFKKAEEVGPGSGAPPAKN